MAKKTEKATEQPIAKEDVKKVEILSVRDFDVPGYKIVKYTDYSFKILPASEVK